MLNIISRSIVSKQARGPRKVAQNLILGLQELNYPYVVNAGLETTDRLWIHDDPAALELISTLPEHIKVIVGPNIHTTKRDLPVGLDLKRAIWLSPSSWVKDWWQSSGFQHKPHEVWPVGIDTKSFSPTMIPKTKVLVYVKQRRAEDVTKVVDGLRSLGEDFEVIRYGQYEELEYREALSRAKALIWLGRSESQGIALLEALSFDVPTLVIDIDHFGDWEGPGQERFTTDELEFEGATSAPYFDNTCGLKVYSIETALDVLPSFLPTLSDYNPRRFVEQKLSLKGQARAFLELYERHGGLSYEQGFYEVKRSGKPWKNATWSYKIYSIFKNFIKNFRS